MTRRSSGLGSSGLVAALLVGCASESTTDPTTGAEPARPASISIAPSTVSLTALDDTARLSAEVRDQSDRTMAAATVAWSSSDASVATASGSGLVTAVGNGTATITATAGSATGTAAVTVAQEASAVTISPAADTIAPGDTFRLVAEAFDENGHAVAGAEFTWSSNNGSVAMVDAAGFVLGVAEGTATITAAVGSTRGAAQITVANHNGDPDRAALVALYNVTDGPNWVKNGNWLTDAPLATWHGVRTNSSGRVIRLKLGSNALTGPIPPELGDLAALTTLALLDNELTGPIPPELGDLAALTSLALNGNELTGPIPPEFGDLAALTTLALNGNALTGPIPPELAGLANLEVLYLFANALSGPIPPELGGLAALRTLNLSNNALSGPIPPELGELAALTTLALNYTEFTGPIPPELGDLAALTSLTLSGNELTGPIPPELGDLAALTSLVLRDNELTGPLPQRLLNLDRLDWLALAENAALCVPGTSDFATWLERIESHDAARVDSCNAPDVAALKSLYEAAGGVDWTHSDGWLGEQPPEEWYGVATDSLGRVVTLDLAGNGLTGQLPRNLDGMARLAELRIGDNALSGRLPLSLARLSLRVLHYADTGLCAPAEESFREWLDDIDSHEGTGIECPPLSEREVLETLYEAAGGPDWTHNGNWMTDAPLEEWYGVRVDAGGRVAQLLLEGNNLEGSIPPELGNLAHLTELGLHDNDLTGRIPPELGNLVNLEWLHLFDNGLSGRIPPELGSLASLLLMDLRRNGLTGRIPPELGSLSNLKWLFLDGNRLNGPIPPELGRLVNLRVLHLNSNDLNGPIPPELGDLAGVGILLLNGNELSGAIPAALGNLPEVTGLRLDDNALSGALPPQLGRLATLEGLTLDNNDLAGPVPPEFGQMRALKQLSFTNNSDMAGPLPADLTALHRLDVLTAVGTGLCAPADPAFQDWLKGVYKRRIANCRTQDPPMAYLTQAVQSREFPVPLVAGEKALLRVFVTAGNETAESIPPVRARFYHNGRETHVEDIPAKSTPIPTGVDESDLSKSANAEIPGSVIRPGLEMVVEVDPDGTLDEGLLVAKRIPEEGRLALEVGDLPPFDLTLIPFVWNETNDSSIVDLVEAMAADPEDHDTLYVTRTLLPIGRLRVTAHEPVLSSSNNAHRLLSETRAIRAMEGGTGHWQGLMKWPVTGAAGTAVRPGRSSFSLPHGVVMAHELGHNLSLSHAPCGNAGGIDPSYPYGDGSVGSWGYDFRDGGGLIRPATPDLMSYCGPRWISDYHFTNALRFRLGDVDTVDADPERGLLLWGGIGIDGVPFLDPAFVVEAPPTLPQPDGEYRIAGRTAGGRELFSLAFAMPVVADGDGSSSFAFVLPVRPGWEDLAGITLSGPGGSATLDGNSDIPMAIVRDPSTGQVRAILRDPPPPTQLAADARAAGTPGLEVLFSRGIPGSDAWRR